ncbi:cation/h(+) antiporter 18 [Quercus suber]|uniref:Cation/h(+) antiporter 18 n=1 Tax=Quercus suber TaxID=58331 RepID=A0AAW0JES6_QUESU
MVSNATAGLICPSPMKPTSNGIFQGDDPLQFTLPLGGILLGPSALGRSKSYMQAIFPPKSLPVLDTLANIGLLLFLFLAGLELDLKSLRQTGKKALGIALAGISLPFALGIGSSYVLKETISKAQRCHEGEPVKETYICATLAVVLAAGLVTDAIGIHAMFGAFVIGVLIPKDGPFAGTLVEKVEDLVSGLFLPLYFVSSGLKTNIATIQGLQSWGLLVLVIFTACFGKIFGTILVTLLCKAPLREALTLGFLMNTKGLVELIVLNIGKDRKVLNDQTFAIMVLMALFTTFITTPIVMAIYKPEKRKRMADYKNRTIERKNPNTQLRILTCYHSARNIPSIINLLEASRGSEKREGLSVDALHLMELSERSSAIIMVHKARKHGLPFWNKSQQSDSNQVVVAFEAYRQLSHVSIGSMKAISSMSDMHEDILGILVDRGLGGTTQVAASNVSYFIMVPFFGGCDDREALAYGVRMAEHPGIRLMVIRFIVEPESMGEIVKVNIDSSSSTKLRSSDEEFLAEFKQNMAKDDSIKYEEKLVRNVADTIAVLSELKCCNLFLVGRMPECEAALDLSRSTTE